MSRADDYTYRISRDDRDGIFVARVEEFEALAAHGDTAEAALNEIRFLVDDVIKDIEETGEPVPAPLRRATGPGESPVQIPVPDSPAPGEGTAPGGGESHPRLGPMMPHQPNQAPFAASQGSDALLFSGPLQGGRYKVSHLLGTGAMGEVYYAWDQKLHEPVALKFLPRLLENDWLAIVDLLREVTVARKVAHPNVCRVYDVGEAQGHHFISMEYIDGVTLDSMIHRLGRPRPERAIEIALQICNGLAAAHEQQVLHRDLKPSNLMLDQQGRLRITDFGLAIAAKKIVGEEAKRGTAVYMAPEQLDPDEEMAEATIKSDLYGLGLVLYEMFTGQKAFTTDFPKVMLQRKREMAFVPPSVLVNDLDPKVERAILDCLHGNPDLRPASALQVAKDLSEVLRTLLSSDLVDRSGLAERLGDSAADLFRRHDELVQLLLNQHKGSRVDGSDGLLLVFEEPDNAVFYALAYHDALAQLSNDGIKLAAQVGIHVGIVTLRADSPPEAPPDTRDKVSTVLALAGPRQTLMTAAVFDVARSAEEKIGQARNLHWLAHGTYKFAARGELVEIFEVGREGFAPLQAPADSATAKRVAVGPTISGWRAATGLLIPQRQNWRLVKKLGEGGFGEVWLAIQQRTNDHRVFKFCYDLDRLDALKREITLFRFLKWELGDRNDIASILDWNFDESPYFIESEYTPDGNLVEWSEQRGGIHLVPLEERLEIVAQAATALSAAHSAGVLHKDVKPANLLIATGLDGNVQVQLADFGIGMLIERERLAAAKVTDTGLDPDTTWSRAGTRLYMAPEVLGGKAPTVLADIYSLGVFFYQMLVGDLSRALAPGFERDVKDELLREDILAVVDGSPERRLGDARELAKRLRNLKSRREDKAREKKAKADQIRLRRSLAATIIAFLILATFAGNWWRQNQRIAREAKTSEQVSLFLRQMFKLSNPTEALGKKVTARHILDWGANRIESQLSEQPEIQARLMHTMGVAYCELGQYDAAEPLLEKALGIRRLIHDGDHTEVAESLNSSGDVLYYRGQYEQAESCYLEALGMQQRISGERHMSVADTLVNLAIVNEGNGDSETARTHYQQALEMQGQAPVREHARAALNLAYYADYLRSTAKYDEADRIYRKALAIQRNALDEATILNFHGMLLYSVGRPEEAEVNFRKSLVTRNRILGGEHPDAIEVKNNLALALEARGGYREAEGIYRDALSAMVREYGEDNYLVANIRSNLALLLIKTYQHDEAGERLDGIMETVKTKTGDSDSPDVAAVLDNMGFLAECREEYVEAEGYYMEALHMRERLFDNRPHPDIAKTLNRLARLMAAIGDDGRGAEYIEECLRILGDPRFPQDHWRIVYAKIIRGACLTLQGRYAEAEPLLRDGLPIITEITGEKSYYVRDTLGHLVRLYEAWGNPVDAARYRALLEEATSPDSVDG
ncbi:MAG: tetratricopeptide repeat protein [bacterium]|nr:tetratricopeptide repeat protein [bacterium]